jgi:ligand-binding sensor domain-containing protein/signal transduction histidine kinase
LTRLRVTIGALALTSSAVATAAADPRGLDPRKALTQYNLDVWTTADDLPQNSVTSIAQTRDGYLWLGTYGGLVRFDGVRFTVFDVASTPGLKSNGIQALLADRQGGLWIGTNGGGVSHYEDGAFESPAAAAGLGSAVVRALYEDRAGAIWIGTAGGLARWQDGRLTSYGVPEGLTNTVVRAIAEASDGTLWVGTHGGGAFRFDGRSFRPFTKRDGLPNDQVFALLRSSDGTLWIGTNGGGLSRLSEGHLRTFTTRDGLPSDIVWSLHEDALGSVWVGTYGGGIARVRGEQVSVLGSRQGLTNDFVRAVLSDREGSLWVGTYSGGLCRLRDGKFTTYTVREGLSHDFARTILEDRDGSLWVGTTGGGLCRLQDGSFGCQDARSGLDDDIRALYQDEQGTLWVGTARKGLFRRLSSGGFELVGGAPDLSSPNISSIAADGNGGLWVGTNGGGLHHFAGGHWTAHTARDGLASDFVFATHVDHRGSVWVGTDGAGLSRLEQGRFTTFTRKDGLGAEIVFAFHEDASGALWIGTASGLTRFKDGVFTNFTTRDGLVDDVVFQILEDDAGRLWLSGNRGLARVERAQLETAAGGARPAIKAVAYGVADGMKSDECSGIAQPAGIKARDGRLWFPTVHGIVAVDPAHLPLNDIPPPVLVEQVKVDGVPLKSFDVPPGRQRWEFHFTALSFLAPRKVQFRYRLEGFDPDWVAAGTQRTAYYTRLPPGRYTFRVAACNNDGIWNEEGAALQLQVRPYFHETRWFYALLALLVAAASLLGYELRVRRLRVRGRELEALVDTRTRDLLDEKERSEAARQEAERHREVAEGADRTKTELLSIAAHDLKTPLQSIIGFGELLAQSEEGPKSREYGSFSSQAARRMLHIVQRLLQSDALERGLGPERRVLDLGALAASVTEAIRPQAAVKQQTIGAAAAERCLVEGDEEWLRQVLENLLGNAVKYSPPGAPIQLSVRRSNGSVLLEVKDDGPGLTASDMQRLFGRFQRLSARPTAGESASGLGLHLVKQLVERQGGRVWAESEGPGRGSRFLVELPAAAPISVG